MYIESRTLIDFYNLMIRALNLPEASNFVISASSLFDLLIQYG